MEYFTLNGHLWRIKTVPPNAPMLVDRTGKMTVATTDPKTMTVYLSAGLQGGFLNRVLIHELGHCALVSFGLIDDIRRMVLPEHRIEAEEWICNFIADYGLYIFSTANSILGDQAIFHIIPRELERLIA